MKNIWYHGSDKKIELFNPYAFDLGNSFQKFGWSTFCFKDYEYTKNYEILLNFHENSTLYFFYSKKQSLKMFIKKQISYKISRG